MTYISRGTRIIVSRWLDEWDAEYKLRARRKRSDARLKRQSSCEDLRAWVNNNCIKHDYLVELMSDGESTKKNPVRLYGRYIPVPTLLKIMRDPEKESKVIVNPMSGEVAGEIIGNMRRFATYDNEGENLGKNLGKNEGENLAKNEAENQGINEGKNLGKNEGENLAKNEAENLGKKEDENQGINEGKNLGKNEGKNQSKNEGENQSKNEGENQGENKGENETAPRRKSASFDMDNKENLWKARCEKYLLEKRFFECRSLLCKAVGKLEKIDTIVCNANEDCENVRNEEIEAAFRNAKSVCCCSASRTTTSNYTSKLNLKKIKDVNRCTEILRKISELRQKLNTIRDRRKEVNEQIRISRKEKWSSSCQVTELYNRREEAKLKQLQKRLERLVAGKGKLLSELMDAVCSLNKLKKSISRSKSQLSIRSKLSSGVNNEEFRCSFPSPCTCGCQCVESLNTSDVSHDECYEDSRTKSFSHSQDVNNKSFSKNDFDVYKRMRKDQENNDSLWQAGQSQENNGRDQLYNTTSFTVPDVSDPTVQKNYRSFKYENPEKSSKCEKKSKLKFVSVELPCRKESLSSLFESDQTNYNFQEQRDVIKTGSVANSRPNTSPASGEDAIKRNEIPERKIKSETTMEEIEKALRNYEQRLKNLDCLEYKIEKLRQKLLEESRRRQEYFKKKSEEKKMREMEQEKSNREITKLCSENWVLKRKVQQLTAKADIQMKKIECLKESKKKLKEFETEKEELQKELSNYQFNCEDQQKRIFMLEHCVVDQKTKIEKLTNLIKNLKANTVKKSYQEKNAQRSRSYSAESMKGKNTTYSNTHGNKYYGSSSDDDKWNYDDWSDVQETKCQPRLSSQGYCMPQLTKRRGWCAN